MAEATTDVAQSGGGADPVSAIANAASDIVGSVFDFLSIKEIRKNGYQDILANTLPRYRNFKASEEAGDFRLIAVLGVVAVFVVLAAVIIKVKKST